MIELFGDASDGGELAIVRLRVDGDRIVDADADGLTQPLVGLTLLEAAAVPGDRLAVDALANAIGARVKAPRDRRRVAVAMSGGVDSAVALLRAGANAVGVTLRLWLDPHGPDAERACCSPAAVIAARELCHSVGRPHVTLDLREEFRRAVVAPFVRGYAAGSTPNPCLRCNGSFRFNELLAFARRIGAPRLATGHYARIVRFGERRLLARAHDQAKDQSYMLAALDPRRLAGVWFPLGESTKAEVRAEAAQAGLAVASRAESQEACFLAGGDYRDFLGRHGIEAREGPIVDERGRELGRHRGFWRYTVGQRRGLGIAAREPLYAVAARPAANTVVVGPRESLARRRVRARGRLYVTVARGEVKLRHAAPAVPASLVPSATGFTAELDAPVYGVARGQAAVVYAGDVVAGCGVVTAAAT